MTRHAESLPPGARQVFRSGHRLSRAERDARLAALDPEVRRARGLRLSDEPVDMPAELETALLRAWERLPKPVFRVRHILAVLWDRVDPLMLELWADTLGQGANLLYSGPRDRTRPATAPLRWPALPSSPRSWLPSPRPAGCPRGRLPPARQPLLLAVRPGSPRARAGGRSTTGAPSASSA